MIGLYIVHYFNSFHLLYVHYYNIFFLKKFIFILAKMLITNIFGPKNVLFFVVQYFWA